MPRYRIPNDKFTAKDKHKFIPEGEKEVHLLHAADCIFIDTDYLPGYGPEPEPVEEEATEETPEEAEMVAGPSTDWPKKKLIKHAKKLKVYTKKMNERSFTKAKILDAINS